MFSTSQLRGIHVGAADGPIGQVDEVYFDDEKWTLRYLVVDATRLMGRQVLISPVAVTQVDTTRDCMKLSLSRKQIRSSPDFDEHHPVSRQYERTLGAHYGYPAYWIGRGFWGDAAYPRTLLQSPTPHETETMAGTVRDGKSHLWNSKEAAGCHIEALDGESGHLDDFLLEENMWAIWFLTIDASNTTGGDAIVVPQRSVLQVRWPERRIYVGMSREQIRQGPRIRTGQSTREGRPALP